VVTVTEGETRQEVTTATVPAEPVVTVTREDIEPLVVETEAPGAPIVTTDVRSTGETCYNNPSNAEQRSNRCAA
jgi:cytoskeletal protein RodZ